MRANTVALAGWALSAGDEVQNQDRFRHKARFGSVGDELINRIGAARTVGKPPRVQAYTEFEVEFRLSSSAKANDARRYSSGVTVAHMPPIPLAHRDGRRSSIGRKSQVTMHVIQIKDRHSVPLYARAPTFFSQ